MSPRDDGHWFPAKSFGYGWGLPQRWQGWMVLALYMGAVIGIALRFPPQRSLVAFLVCVGVATLLLIAVCAVKGAPPRWRGRR